MLQTSPIVLVLLLLLPSPVGVKVVQSAHQLLGDRLHNILWQALVIF
jgi:hypothetical protein